MLEPGDRLLLFEALRPPEGFRFDQGIGTTYSLDLLTLLTAPLAFTWFEQQGEEDKRTGIDSLEILESLRRHADQLTIFCHAGRIALPKTFYPQLAFVEESIIECQPEKGGAFHPKVWVLRWISDSDLIRYRILCLSRNLTFARAWDTLLSLDGELSSTRRGAISRNRGLVDFVRALPRFARSRPIGTKISKRLEILASELGRTEFNLPDGMTDLRFWPMGIGGRRRDPLAEARERLLVVSPFVTLGRLEEMADGREDVTLISTPCALAHLARRPKGVSKFYSLIDRAMIEVNSELDEKPESEAEAIEQSDLHAKLYVSESGWGAHVWTGSANATASAFEANVEFLVELIGPRKRFGIDALMEAQIGEVRFVNLLEDAGRLVASEREDPVVEALEQKLGLLRESIARASLEADVTTSPGGAFDVELVCRATDNTSIDPDVTARCWPVTVTNSVGVSFKALDQGKAIARFSGLSFEAITSFFAFELTGQVSGEERQARFVVNVTLIGAPADRREHVLRSLVRDRSRMLHFLRLLLADEGVVIPELNATNMREGPGSEARSRTSASGIFEMLLRNLDRSPERLDNLHNLLKELRHGAEGEDLLPEDFDSIWQPIWFQREHLRSRTKI